MSTAPPMSKTQIDMLQDHQLTLEVVSNIEKLSFWYHQSNTLQINHTTLWWSYKGLERLGYQPNQVRCQHAQYIKAMAQVMRYERLRLKTWTKTSLLLDGWDNRPDQIQVLYASVIKTQMNDLWDFTSWAVDHGSMTDLAHDKVATLVNTVTNRLEEEGL